MVLALLKLMGLGGLLFVWITQTRINTANYYLATIFVVSWVAVALVHILSGDDGTVLLSAGPVAGRGDGHARIRL